MKLSELRAAEVSIASKNFRRGRGHGSGNGTQAGKGHKGQKARSGAPRLGFEGGQMPLYRRLPKRGFTPLNRLSIVAINIRDLNKFNDGDKVTCTTLKEKGIIKDCKDGVKLLANGELNKKLDITLCFYSEAAKQKVEKAGGTITTCQKKKTSTKEEK